MQIYRPTRSGSYEGTDKWVLLLDQIEIVALTAAVDIGSDNPDAPPEWHQAWKEFSDFGHLFDKE